MTHTAPSSSSKKHQIVTAGREIRAGHVTPVCWQCAALRVPGVALVHHDFPLGQLVLSGEDSCCAANYIRNEIYIFVYGCLPLGWTGMQAACTASALLQVCALLQGGRGNCTSECLRWRLVSLAIVSHQLVLKYLLMFCFSDEHFQEKQGKMPGSDPLTLVWPFALKRWLKDHRFRSNH